MVRHVDVGTPRRHTVRAGRDEIDLEELDDTVAKPARCVVDLGAIEGAAQHVEHDRYADPTHRTCNAKTVDDAHLRSVYSEVGYTSDARTPKLAC